MNWRIVRLGRLGGLQQVGGFGGRRDKADVEVLHCRADYWVAKWELQTKLGLQILVQVLVDLISGRLTRFDRRIRVFLSFVTFVNIVR